MVDNGLKSPGHAPWSGARADPAWRQVAWAFLPVLPFDLFTARAFQADVVDVAFCGMEHHCSSPLHLLGPRNPREKITPWEVASYNGSGMHQAQPTGQIAAPTRCSRRHLAGRPLRQLVQFLRRGANSPPLRSRSGARAIVSIRPGQWFKVYRGVSAGSGALGRNPRRRIGPQVTHNVPV